MEPNPYEAPAEVFDEGPRELTEPPKLSVRLERSGDTVRIVNVRRQWAVAGFLLFWLTIWTCGCIALVAVVLTQFSFFTLLFALPFWAAEIFVFCLLSTMIAAREDFMLDESGVAYRYRVWGLPVIRRTIPLREITSFEGHYELPTDSKGRVGNAVNAGNHSLLMNTIGAPLRFISGIDQHERMWLSQTLNESLASLKRYSGPIERTSEGAVAAPMPTPDELPPVLELRPPSTTQVAAPSDTTWTQHYDFDAITFKQRGRLSLVGLGVLLFVCAFWNGIVGVFIGGLFGFTPDGNKAIVQGAEWWFLFLFLIPFELIGLVIILGLIAALLEPFRRTRWIVKRNAVAYRNSYFGIGWTKTYEISELDRLELRKGDDDKDDEDDGSADEAARAKRPRKRMKKQQRPKETVQVGDGSTHAVQFELALVDRQGKDVCEIGGLGLGEACWMADVILRERSGWFV